MRTKHWAEKDGWLNGPRWSQNQIVSNRVLDSFGFVTSRLAMWLVGLSLWGHGVSRKQRSGEWRRKAVFPFQSAWAQQFKQQFTDSLWLISSRFRVDFESISSRFRVVSQWQITFCRVRSTIPILPIPILRPGRALQTIATGAGAGNSISRFFLLQFWKSFGSFCSAKIRGIIWIAPTLCIQLHTISYYIILYHTMLESSTFQVLHTGVFEFCICQVGWDAIRTSCQHWQSRL